MSLRTFSRACASRALRIQRARLAPQTRIPTRMLSDSIRHYSNITYSGGHASEGQGGFYGSGGSRVAAVNVTSHPEALADAAAVIQLQTIMDSVRSMQDGDAQELSMEAKASIRKTMTDPKTMDLLLSLEIKGQPKWGLSVTERTLVKEARELANSC